MTETICPRAEERHPILAALGGGCRGPRWQSQLSGRHGTKKRLCSEGNLIDLIYLQMDEEQPRSSEYRESWFTAPLPAQEFYRDKRLDLYLLMPTWWMNPFGTGKGGPVLFLEVGGGERAKMGIWGEISVCS